MICKLFSSTHFFENHLPVQLADNLSQLSLDVFRSGACESRIQTLQLPVPNERRPQNFSEGTGIRICSQFNSADE
jgi:hypothetical protein